jgi:hypothetical protein
VFDGRNERRIISLKRRRCRSISRSTSTVLVRMAMIAAFESPASAAMVAGAVNPTELSRARN